MRRARAAGIAAILAAGALPHAAGDHVAGRSDAGPVHHTVYLMGTRASLAVDDPSRQHALSLIDAAVRTLEETEAELSTWRSASAVSVLNAAPIGAGLRLSPSLCRLMADLQGWTRETAGAFDPAIGALADAWRIHDGGRVPAADVLQDAQRRTGLHLIDFEPQSCSATRLRDVTIDAGGFGKGEALDRAAAVMGDARWLIDLGGQVAVGAGRDGRPWSADIAHPAQRDRAAVRVRLAAGSLSTSGSSERDHIVGGTRVGHILDPRTGRPAPFSGSVTVWHEQALAADVLSTALYVMGPEAGLAWAERRGIAALYATGAGGGTRLLMTPAFRPLIDGR